MKKAILSVSDKTGLVEFAQQLVEQGYELYSTGGTMKALETAQTPVKSVSELTQFDEILDGRVKTLHPAVHGGILADRDKAEHLNQLKEQHIDLIDMVVVNLYPFKETVANPGVTEEDAIENIDIGGPTMLRAAAKNFKHVTTVVDPVDYHEVIDRVKNDTLDESFRKSLMVKVFGHTQDYDQAIVQFFNESKETLRYGENPQQSAYFVRESNTPHTLAGAKQLHGKQLSFNNIKDADSALALVKQYDGPAAVAVKHMNPCGVGIGDTIEEAYARAYEADSQSIFGGIVALNRPVDEALATELHKIFLEVVIAPSFTDAALEVLEQKKNIRLLEIKMDQDESPDMVSVSGGYLVQEKDRKQVSREDMTVATETAPTEAQWEAMLFGWSVVRAVKSNAVILTNAHQTLGVGAGQSNRVGSARIAIECADHIEDNVVMVSDGFFPMDDTVELAAQHGIKAIIQPGGSKKDQDSIDMANKHGIAMVMTGVRHFKH
ncbi:MAG TPA: bifunctional phosphoribosylaminoimidazolecarboxamide formyltransferase/IMP cyclohydrolase [Staphylococcus auricularis]|nr:bifunctional phosphoribosylaminoimidazolecarboxamide formyltransferase/IMP cyclohydrolase [Staphylococcus auricularis]